MRLKVSPASKQQHTDAVAAAAWVGSVGGGSLLVTCSEDGSVGSWSSDGEWRGTALQTPEYGVCDVHVNPAVSDALAVACSDGHLRLCSRATAGSSAAGSLALKEDKRVPATTSGGALVCARWSYDGAAIATGGEDGSVKIWSRAGG
jgi:intraflagellar transport protein 80